MICKTCGSQVMDGAVVCSNCGGSMTQQPPAGAIPIQPHPAYQPPQAPQAPQAPQGQYQAPQVQAPPAASSTFCGNCGKPVGPADPFCGACGTARVAVSSTPGTPAAPATGPLQGKQVRALAVLVCAAMLVSMLLGWVSTRIDIDEIMWGSGFGNVSLNNPVFALAGSLGIMLDTMEYAIEEELRGLRGAERRAAEREMREEMEEELGPFLFAARFFRTMSVFLAISILGLLAFLYLALIEHKLAALIGMIGSGLASLTALIVLIGTSRAQSAIDDIRDLRNVFSVGNTFWVWATLILGIVLIGLITNLKKQKLIG